VVTTWASSVWHDFRECVVSPAARELLEVRLRRVVAGQLGARACAASGDFVGSSDRDHARGVTRFGRFDHVEVSAIHAARKSRRARHAMHIRLGHGVERRRQQIDVSRSDGYLHGRAPFRLDSQN
jgi:hypothetical protein